MWDKLTTVANIILGVIIYSSGHILLIRTTDRSEFELILVGLFTCGIMAMWMWIIKLDNRISNLERTTEQDDSTAKTLQKNERDNTKPQGEEIKGRPTDSRVD